MIVAVNSHSTVSAYTFAIDIFHFETAGCFPLICVLHIHHDKQVYSLNFVLRNLDLFSEGGGVGKLSNKLTFDRPIPALL